MAFNKAEYDNKYQRDNYDRIAVSVPKGQRAIIQAHAKAKGQSVNAYILELLRRDIPELQKL